MKKQLKVLRTNYPSLNIEWKKKTNEWQIRMNPFYTGEDIREESSKALFDETLFEKLKTSKKEYLSFLLDLTNLFKGTDKKVEIEQNTSLWNSFSSSFLFSEVELAKKLTQALKDPAAERQLKKELIEKQKMVEVFIKEADTADFQPIYFPAWRQIFLMKWEQGELIGVGTEELSLESSQFKIKNQQYQKISDWFEIEKKTLKKEKMIERFHKEEKTTRFKNVYKILTETIEKSESVVDEERLIQLVSQNKELMYAVMKNQYDIEISCTTKTGVYKNFVMNPVNRVQYHSLKEVKEKKKLGVWLVYKEGEMDITSAVDTKGLAKQYPIIRSLVALRGER